MIYKGNGRVITSLRCQMLSITFTELNEDGLHPTDEMQPINIVMLIFIWLSQGTDKQQINNWRTQIRAPSLLQIQNKNTKGHKVEIIQKLLPTNVYTM